jgi:hypothetical protein
MGNGEVNAMVTLMQTSLVERQKQLSVLSLFEWKAAAQGFFRQRAVLKTPLRENWHCKAGQLCDSPRHDLTFQFVESSHAVLSEVDEWDRLGHCNYAWSRERAETGETVMMGGRIGARV